MYEYDNNSFHRGADQVISTLASLFIGAGLTISIVGTSGQTVSVTRMLANTFSNEARIDFDIEVEG